MTRIFRYILAHDSGMAPCVGNGLLTLATCKPGIRSSAKIGDWIIGCRPSPAPRGLVVWAGCVIKKLHVGEYERQFRGRSDAVYREKNDSSFRRLRPEYHPEDDEFRKDTSHPVLIFDMESTWYFARDPNLMPESLIHLAPKGRPYSVNGTKLGEPEGLNNWLCGIASPGIRGVPRDRPPSGPKGGCSSKPSVGSMSGCA